MYQFTQDSYYHSRRKSPNDVLYFVSDEFIKKYPNHKELSKSGVEYEIEKEYLGYVGEKCQNTMQYKEQLEYRLRYLGYNRYHKSLLQQQINSLDYSSCEKYKKLKKKIRY